MTKGQVMRDDDGRKRPHSEAHRAAIAVGMARSRWIGRQFADAIHGEPHALVPLTAKAVQAFSNPRVLTGRSLPVLGECHACYLADRISPHVDDDPEPVEADEITLDRAATIRVKI